MESGEGNAKRGCGRWMEECGRSAAVEQLTARDMEYQSPQLGAIVKKSLRKIWKEISIPAMGGNRNICLQDLKIMYINPRNGGGNSDLEGGFRQGSHINPRNGGQ